MPRVQFWRKARSAVHYEGYCGFYQEKCERRDVAIPEICIYDGSVNLGLGKEIDGFTDG